MEIPLFDLSILSFCIVFSIGIYWTSYHINGLQLTYVLLVSIYLSNTLNVLADLKNISSTFLQPSLYSMVISCLAISLGEITRKRYKICYFVLYSLGVLLLSFIADYTMLLGYIYVVLLYIPAYRTKEWITQIPNTAIILTALIFPTLLFFLNTSSVSLLINSTLMGLGIGSYIERIKVKIEYTGPLVTRIKAVIIGLVGVFVTSTGIAFVTSAFGIILGFWISYFAPLLFAKLSIYSSRVITYGTKPTLPQ